MFSYSQIKMVEVPISNHIPEEKISEDYKVKVNGEEIPVYTCRISKYPFNRFWPGYQRSREQTVEASYVNLISDEELNLEVTITRPFERVQVKPYSKNIKPQQDQNVLKFTIKPNDKIILTLGDYAHCLYIFNSKPFICEDSKSVTYYFGPGIHFPGKITLKDNESVYVDKDAVVYGSVFARNANNIRVFGNGIFDDSMEERVFANCYDDYTIGNARFYKCRNVTVEGVSFRNSAAWCVSVWGSYNVNFDDIKVYAQWRYNTDGVDIVNSQDVSLTNSFIHSFDDSVVVKGVEKYCHIDNKNVYVNGCVLLCDWGRACEIGLETNCKTYDNIVFENCDVVHGGCVAFDIQNGDYAEVKNVSFINNRVEYERFHRPEILQRTEDQKYDAMDKTISAYLFMISNHRSYCNIVPSNAEEMGCPAAQVHDILVKDTTVYYDDAIPLIDGKFQTFIGISSVVNKIEHYNITVENVTINGVKGTVENIPLNLSKVKNFVLK